MEFENIDKKLSLLYNKAINEFKICISDEENDFLKSEVNLPVESIKIVEKDIKIVFSRKVFERYKFEVSLLLFEGDKEIGKYMYIEDDRGNGMDDSLIFY